MKNDGFSFIAIVFSPELIAPEYDNLYKKFMRPIIKNKLALPVILPDEIVNIIIKTKGTSDMADFGYELAIKGIFCRCYPYTLPMPKNIHIQKTPFNLKL